MVIKSDELSIGDVVEYLGGDKHEKEGQLVIGGHYEIVGIDEDGDPFFETGGESAFVWEHAIGAIGNANGFEANQNCFKKVSN